MLAYTDAAKRAKSEEERLGWLETTAGFLGIGLNFTESDPPERRLRDLAQFETWYEKNKDRIRFDSKGEPHFGSGPGEWKPPKLKSEDRARIKADPACVLRLFDSFASANDPDNSQIYEMNARCGQALMGAEGSSALSRVLEQTEDGSDPGFDLQMSFQSAAANYPITSAALAAAAYVAGDATASAEIRKLAKETVEDFGEDLDEVLKTEPSSVKKKVRELLDESDK